MRSKRYILLGTTSILLTSSLLVFFFSEDIGTYFLKIKNNIISGEQEKQKINQGLETIINQTRYDRVGWKSYENDDFGVNFKYPKSGFICNLNTIKETKYFSVAINIEEDCATAAKNQKEKETIDSDIVIEIKKIPVNTMGAQKITPESYFEVHKQINPDTGYFILGGLTFYGGKRINTTNGPAEFRAISVFEDGTQIQVFDLNYYKHPEMANNILASINFKR